MTINMNDTVKIIINSVLAVLGFLLVWMFNNTQTQLANINSDILQLRIDVSEINMKLMTDERVKELIHLELNK